MAAPVFFSLDIRGNYDKIQRLNALTELSLKRSHEREGTVGALGRADGQATPERPSRRRTAHPRYRMM